VYRKNAVTATSTTGTTTIIIVTFDFPSPGFVKIEVSKNVISSGYPNSCKRLKFMK
jgi:hypothetical protein